MELSDSDRNRTYCWVEGSLKKRAELLILFLEGKFTRFISEELRMFRSWPNDFQSVDRRAAKEWSQSCEFTGGGNDGR